mgnify:CR=1 FL=1
MKTIGLVGGITWHSTLDYYRLINEMVNERVGGFHSAKLLIHSLDFSVIKELTLQEDWDNINLVMRKAAASLEAGGADCIMLGANTMHNIADKLIPHLHVPLIHIADAVAEKIKEQSIDTVALLGTKYTMQMDFYKDRLLAHGIKTIIPDDTGIEMVNNSIYDEFSKGIFREETKQQYIKLIKELNQQGAGGVILGCTEIPILIKQSDSPIPVFDSAMIHSAAAVDFALM